jgi:TPR repeat protein
MSRNNQARTPSSQGRRSPDTRPLSYIDLLSLPYSQQTAPNISFNHNHLQSAVGSNASLLSTKQTLDMYRANVKKTNDSAIQYSFAIFMLEAAQDARTAETEQGVASRNELILEARQILQRLADKSYPFAQYYLADGYASGVFNKGKEDNDKAFPFFIAASKHGHAEAGYRAALCYEFGWGTRKDPLKAVQFYRQSASKNHPGAMVRLGRACMTGDLGLGNRYREGVKWLKRATESADFQYNTAPYELGVLHENGYGDDIFRDETYAAQLFTQSADLGHAEASFRLGDAYEHGKLTCPRDPALSVHFYNGAASRGHPQAMMALCAWYMVGAEPVLEKDENEAYEWAKKAAECGALDATSNIDFTADAYRASQGRVCRRLFYGNGHRMQERSFGSERLVRQSRRSGR